MDNVNTYKVNEEAVKKIAERVYDNGSTVINRNDLEEMFPELKESKDEMIRGKIIATIHLYYGEPLEDEAKEMIAWLDKQVEQKTTIEIKTPEESLGIDSDTYNKIVDDCVYGEQKPVEFKPSFRVGDVIKPKDPVLGEPRIVKGIHPKFGYDTNNGILDFEFEDNWELVEQKPADKVEPKFHEGEWLCENKPTNYAHFIQILEIVNVQGKDRYRISRDLHNDEDVVEFGFIEKYYHKFDIQDAKDGDVLINWNNTTFIFKAIEDETVKFHIAYNEKWDAIKTPSTKISHLGLPEPQFEFHPAAKEERDTLMKAMTDAGYEFDFENKELKKIEQKPVDADLKDVVDKEANAIWKEINTGGSYSIIDSFNQFYGICMQVAEAVVDCKKPSWSEEDNGFLNLLLAVFTNEHPNGVFTTDNITAFKGNCVTSKRIIAWLKSLKDRVQPKQEWSGGDEAHLHSLITHLEQWIESNPDTTGADIQGENVAWLKSLRPQSHWKPSDEQMTQLKKYCPDNRPLTSLYEQLKKLKG